MNDDRRSKKAASTFCIDMCTVQLERPKIPVSNTESMRICYIHVRPCYFVRYTD